MSLKIDHHGSSTWSFPFQNGFECSSLFAFTIFKVYNEYTLIYKTQYTNFLT